MELKKSIVKFDPESHTYTLLGKQISGVTPIVAWMFPDTYASIPDEVLNRAAERGSKIHAECQMIDNLGFTPDGCTEEALQYAELCREHNLKAVANEYLVSDGTAVASSIDVVYQSTDGAENVVDIADIKTTSSLHRDNVTLQLSIYADMLERQNRDFKVGRMFAVWLPKPQYGRPQVIELSPRIDKKTCRQIIKSYLNGEDSTRYRERLFGKQSYETLPAEVADAEMQITALDAQLSDLKAKREQLQSGLLKLMKANGVKKYESDKVIITYVAPTIRTSLDTARIKDEYPDIYGKCLKQCEAKESIRIKIKQ